MSYNRFILLMVFTLTIGAFGGCTNKENSSISKEAPFSFSDTVKIDNKINSLDCPTETIKIAVSAISSPRETFTYYEEMFKYIEKKLGMRVMMVQRKTYKEVNDLLKLNEVDLAFVCSGGYIYGVADSAFNLLVVPERDGLRKYQTYIIVNNNSNIKSFEELKGKRFAFTDPLSTSGTIYPSKRIEELGSNPNDFFANYTYTYAHDNSIQLVAKQMVDGAAVNSLVFDYLNTVSPERTKNIRIIEKSEWHGMPPVVISYGVKDELRKELETIFLNIHEDEGSKRVLEKLMVDKYVKESDSIFTSVRDMVELLNHKHPE
jgi:phosphonate transport system substrate-binding protein